MVQVPFEAVPARTENYSGMPVTPALGGGTDENGEIGLLDTCFSPHQTAGGRSTYRANETNSSPRSINHWELRTLQIRLIEIGAKVVRHARYTCIQMAEVSISRNLFVAIPRRTRRLMQPVPV